MNRRRWKLTAVACAVGVAGFAAQARAAGPAHPLADAPLAPSAPVFAPDEQSTPVVGAALPDRLDAREDDYSWERKQSRAWASDTGFYFLIGGGMDFFTGDFKNLVKNGPAAGAMIGYRAMIAGIEASYNAGGYNTKSNLGSGLDILRHSGQLAVTLSTPTRLQIFALGGGGRERYHVRHPGGGSGFSTGTNWYVPAGGGIRYEAGSFLTIDARYTYNWLFGENFGPANTTGNRMQWLLSLGGTF